MKSRKEREESGFRKLCNHLKGLTFEQKVDHIFTYYWGTLLLVILIPVVLGILLSSVLKDRPEVVFTGNCCNVTLTDQGSSYLINDWNALLNMEPGTLELNLDFSQTAGLNGGYDIDGGMQVVASVAANDLDYLICDSVAMDYFAVQRAFLPLEEVLTEETLSQWSDRIYTYTDAEDGTSYAAGLEVSDLPFFRDCIQEEGKVYFVFANKTEPDLQRLQLFLSHLTAWEGE